MSAGSGSVPIVEETINSGASWSQFLIPSAMPQAFSISCASTTICVIGGQSVSYGYYDYAFAEQITVSGGTASWTPSGDLAADSFVVSVSCTSESDCAALDTQHGTLYYSTNAGSTWTESTSSIPNASGSGYNAISCQQSGSAATCVAVGECVETEEVSCVGGEEPEDVAITTFPTGSDPALPWTWAWTGAPESGELEGISCASAAQCLAIGWSGNYSGPNALSIATGGGNPTNESLSTWDSESVPEVNAVSCVTSTECFVGGSFGIEATTNGETFNPVAFEVPPLTDISCGTSTDCLAVTTSGTIAATNNGGALWLNEPPMPASGCSADSSNCLRADSVSCFGPSSCVAQFGDNFGYDGSGNSTYLTTNLGVSWGPGSSAGLWQSCVQASPSATCVGAGSDAYGSSGWQPYESTNGGSTWSPVTVISAPATGSASAISCGLSTLCLVVGTNTDTGGTNAEVVFDSGTSWGTTPISIATASGLSAVSCLSLAANSITCMAVGGGGEVLQEYVSISGSTVTTSTTSLSGEPNVPTGNLDAVACDPASSGTLACSIFGVDAGAETVNGGSSFTSIAALPLVNASIASASCGGPGDCYAVGTVTGGNPGGALILSTNGQTSPAFLPSSVALVDADSIGGADGSRPCFACALKSLGYSAQGFDGDPVNTADGDYTESIPIVSIPGLGPNLSFTVTYDSQLAQTQTEAALVAGRTSPPGPLGWGWSANSSMSLSGTSPSGGDITVNEEGGAQVTFVPEYTGVTVTGGSCTTTSSTQCFVASESDVTAVLEETLGTSDTYQFSRNNGLDVYNFNSSGQLTSISDANGYAETFSYGTTSGTNCSASGTACDTETDAAHRTLDIVYSTSTNLVSKVIDPAGRTWSFAYDGNGNLISITNPRSGVESFGYDTASANPTMVHNMTTLTEPNGQSGGDDVGDHLSIAYEESGTSSSAPLGYVISQTDPVGLYTTFSYAGNNMAATGTTTITQFLTTTSTSPQSESEDEYVQGVLVAHVDGVNTTHPETTSFVRNAQLMPTQVTDPNSHVSEATYDGNGNLLTSTDASSNTWTYTYNSFNEVLTATPPSGSSQPETINTYDADGNQETSAQHPSSGSNLTTTDHLCESATCSVSGNSYQQGEIESTTDPRSNATTFTYDTYGDQTSSTDPLGDDTTDAYTSIGQLYCSTSPKATAASVVCPSSPSTRVANTTSLTFDSSDTVVPTSTDPLGNTTDYTYDADGNQIQVETPAGVYNLNVYDADDRSIEVVGGFWTSAQTVTTTAYDVAPGSTNCSSSVTNATSCTVVTQAEGIGTGTLNAVTSSYYDAFGNLIQTTDPGGEVTADTYDQANNLHTTTTGAGTTTYAYQPNNWLSTETYSGATSGFSAPSTSTSFTYFNDGARKTMVDSTGTTTYGYDGYGRLDSVVDGAGNKVTYGYNADGSVNCLSYPNSGSSTCLNASSGTGIIAYVYDAADRMISLTDWNSAKITFGYNADSDWTGISYPTTAATTVANTYGNDDNLTKEITTNTNLSGGSQSTTWTPNADDLFATTKANSGTANAYGYDSLNEVTSLAGSDSYTYDQLGRMTSDTVGSATTNDGYTTDSALCWSGTGTGTCSSPPSGATVYGSNAIDARCYSTTSTKLGVVHVPSLRIHYPVLRLRPAGRSHLCHRGQHLELHLLEP
jgi:YD repeat-containing protein